MTNNHERDDVSIYNLRLSTDAILQQVGELRARRRRRQRYLLCLLSVSLVAVVAVSAHALTARSTEEPVHLYYNFNAPPEPITLPYSGEYYHKVQIPGTEGWQPSVAARPGDRIRHLVRWQPDMTVENMEVSVSLDGEELVSGSVTTDIAVPLSDDLSRIVINDVGLYDYLMFETILTASCGDTAATNATLAGSNIYTIAQSTDIIAVC